MEDFEVALPDGSSVVVSAPDAKAAAAAARSHWSSKSAEAASKKTVPSYDPFGIATGMVEEPAQPSNLNYNLNDLARQAAVGATFNLADKIAAGGNALFGQGTYAENLKKERQLTKEAGERMGPLAFVPSAVGGVATGSTLAKGGLSLVGKYGPNFGLLGNAGLGATEAGLYGAAHGAGSTDTGNLIDYPVNAAIEGAKAAPFGVIPSAIIGATRIPAWAADKLGNVSKSTFEAMPESARRILSSAMGWDKNTAARLAELGPEAMLGDTGPGMRGVAQGVVSRPSEGASTLTSALEARNAGRTGRLQQETEGAFGRMTADELQANSAIQAQRDQLHKGIPAALENVGPIDPTPVVNTIDRLLATAKGPEKSALEHARSMLVKPTGNVSVGGVPAPAGPTVQGRADLLQPEIPGAPISGGGLPGYTVPVKNKLDLFNAQGPAAGLETNPVALANAKTALSQLVEHGSESLGVPAGALTKKEGSTKFVIGQLNELLRKASPEYADIMAQSSSLARQAQGIETGYNSLEGGKGAIKPRQIEEALSAAPETLAAPGAAYPGIKAGARARIENAVGTNPNDLVALRRIMGGEGDWNRAKLESIYGKEAVDKMLGAIGRESVFAGQYADVLKGSQTAQRVGASGLLDAAEMNLPSSVSATGMVTNLVKAAANKLLGTSSSMAREQVRNNLGKALSLKGEELDNFMRQLDAYNAARQATAKGSGAAISGIVPGLLQ